LEIFFFGFTVGGRHVCVIEIRTSRRSSRAESAISTVSPLVRANTRTLAMSACSWEDQLFFVRERTLRELRRLPRRGSDALYRHPVTGLPNENGIDPKKAGFTIISPSAARILPVPRFPNGERDLRVHVSLRDLRQSESKICYVFVSHRWLRPGSGLPDDASDSKCALVISALERLRGPHAPVPEDVDFALWIDWSCLDQENPHVAHELNTTMRDIMECCDLVLTPVVDPDYGKWGGVNSRHTLPDDGWLEGYQAQEWANYLDRGWCRAEMMLGAAYAVKKHAERAALFRGVF
jgi:hypothetical protein